MNSTIVKYLTMLTPSKVTFHTYDLTDEKGKKVSKDLKTKLILDDINLEWDDDYNHWEYIAIGVTDEGYFKYHHVPGGYSEYTYEPSEESILYRGWSLDKFVNLALTESERQAIMKIIKGTANE